MAPNLKRLRQLPQKKSNPSGKKTVARNMASRRKIRRINRKLAWMGHN